MKFLRHMMKHQPIASAIFAIALAVCLFFGGNFVADFIYFHDPAHRNQSLEGWMTPRYVGMSYSLPEPVIREIFHLDEFKGERLHLSGIAERLGKTLPELEAEVLAAQQERRDRRRD